jgi:uncharacterized lipoprotein
MVLSLLLRLIVAGAAACCLTACNTIIDEKTSIDFVPSSVPGILPGAENVSLSVVAVDKRTQYRDRISSKRTAVGTIVTPTNDVIDLVRRAVEQEFKAEGFVIGDGGIAVTVEVQNFYTDFPMPGLTMSAAADVALTLRAKNSADVTLYSRFYDGTGKVDPIFNESAANVKIALQQALANAIQQMVEDKALQSALLSARANSSAFRRP